MWLPIPGHCPYRGGSLIITKKQPAHDICVNPIVLKWAGQSLDSVNNYYVVEMVVLWVIVVWILVQAACMSVFLCLGSDTRTTE